MFNKKNNAQYSLERQQSAMLRRETLRQTARVLVPDTPFIVCVTLGKSLNFSVPQFPM